MSTEIGEGLAGPTDSQPLRIIYTTKRNIYEQLPLNQFPACLRCRRQKLRCSKEKPICKRCSSLNASCSYPSPTDRKKLAAQRNFRPPVQDRAKQSTNGLGFPLEYVAENANTDTGTVSQQANATGEQWPTSIPGNVSPLTGDKLGGRESISSPSIPLATQRHSHDAQLHPSPSGEIAMFLIEVYFARAYNADLLFHKPRFLRDWTTDKSPDFIALSIFALASIFLHSGNDQGSDCSGILGLSKFDWRKHGMDWANLASQKVLAQADRPSLPTVQACQNLVLYWFSRNQTDRANFHSNVAYRTCRLLGYHRNDTNEEVDAVTAELRRRCLWSCWMTQCISQENAVFPAGSWSEVAGTLLPVDNASFNDSKPSAREYMDHKWEAHIHGEEAVQPHRASYAAEFAKLLGAWWEIQRSVKRFRNRAPEETAHYLVSLFDLAGTLDRLHDNLPSVLHFDNVVNSASEDLEKVYALDCLYHLCVTSLHAAVVPIVSTSNQSPDIPRRIVESSAQETLSHSSTVLKTASAFLDLTPDVSKTPSITGFCMFVCISIQHKYLSSLGNFRSLYDSFKSALSILNILKDYWEPLQPLAAQLDRQLAKDVNNSSATVSSLNLNYMSHNFGPGLPTGENTSNFPDVTTFIGFEDSKALKTSVTSSATPEDRPVDNTQYLRNVRNQNSASNTFSTDASTHIQDIQGGAKAGLSDTLRLFP